MVVRQY
jgi:hypothetical protein